jgi:hypothetical protein
MTGTQDPDEDFVHSWVGAAFVDLTTQQQYEIMMYARDNDVTMEEAVETVLGDGRTDRRTIGDETPSLYRETLSADYGLDDLAPLTVQHILDNFHECWRLVNAAHGIVSQKGATVLTDEELDHIKVARQRLDDRLAWFDGDITDAIEINALPTNEETTE